jgi:hypothetical protein
MRAHLTGLSQTSVGASRGLCRHISCHGEAHFVWIGIVHVAPDKVLRTIALRHASAPAISPARKNSRHHLANSVRDASGSRQAVASDGPST